MKIELIEKCQSCKGTGLYKGMAERDGYAVVCHRCKGTGKVYFSHEYEEFTNRQPSVNIHTVLKTNPGIMVGGADFKFGGMSYDEWAGGKPFPDGSEMREFTCPAWWYQSADYDKKPEWRGCLVCGSFSSCRHFVKKRKCWERWDKENKMMEK